MKGPRQELHTSKTSWMIKQQQQQIQIIHRNGHFTHLLEIQMIFCHRCSDFSELNYRL